MRMQQAESGGKKGKEKENTEKKSASRYERLLCYLSILLTLSLPLPYDNS